MPRRPSLFKHPAAAVLLPVPWTCLQLPPGQLHSRWKDWQLQQAPPPRRRTPPTAAPLLERASTLGWNSWAAERRATPERAVAGRAAAPPCRRTHLAGC